METHELIKQLSGELKPVKPLSLPERRLGLWVVLAVSCIAAGMVILGLGIRTDFVRSLSDIHFLAEGISALAVAAMAGAGAFILSVPGEENSAWSRWIPFVGIGVWVSVLVWRMFSVPDSFATAHTMLHRGEGCAKMVLVLSIIPAGSLIYMLRKAAPIRRAWTGLLAMMSVGALGSFAAQLFCPGAHPFHIFFWHFLPVLALSGIGIGLGHFFLKWRQNRAS